jgi:hypothetical protein
LPIDLSNQRQTGGTRYFKCFQATLSGKNAPNTGIYGMLRAEGLKVIDNEHLILVPVMALTSHWLHFV